MKNKLHENETSVLTRALNVDNLKIHFISIKEIFRVNNVS
jgi:hypothetical protein